jgi:serine/threonine protein kinase/WD40 repeat protein
MDPKRWERVKTLYDQATSRPVSERAAFLAAACLDDVELQREVLTLLDQPLSTDEFYAMLGGPSSALAAWAAAEEHVPLTGRKIGTFEVKALLGRGGMGEVYRAHDTKLGRDVAIKVLPRAFTTDAGRLANLEREARVVASLSNPHIAAIHGLEESEGVRGLVLELVEGDTLAQRLSQAARSSRPGLRVPEALNYAHQIADALEAAHERGVTHRDLKPANIKITPDGLVKLLDFGIAKVVTGDSQAPELTRAHTATAGATGAGVIVGTAGYMSPEQARGKTVDKRTDIWAFGCVLYEMLSGRMAFTGDTTSDTIAAILEREPDWSTLPADTPRTLRRLLERCLEKEPKQRLRDIGDARLEVERLMRSPDQEPDPAVALQETGRWRRRTKLAVAAAVLLAVASGALVWFALTRQPTSADARVTRFSVDMPKGSVMVPTLNSNLALSPDGRFLAMTPLPGPVSIRRLDGLDSQPLEVTKAPNFRGSPVFSPDGTSISFVEGNGIIAAVRPFFRAPLSGGPATKLADYDNFHGGDWADDGWIYWTNAYLGGIVRVRDTGGPIEKVTELDLKNGERSHRFAHLLPGGQALLFTVSFAGIDSYDDARVDLYDLNTRQRKTLITGGSAAVYSPSGHIVYARAGKLFAVPFDLDRREITGSPLTVVENVMMSQNSGAAHFAISKRGDLAYVPGGVEGGNRTLVWVDRSGQTEPVPLKPASYLYPRIAPDGRSMAVEIEGPNHDFYFYDFARTVLSKVTTDGMSHNPVWSPDGTRLAYRSWVAGGMTMWSMNADRSGTPERLDVKGTRQNPVSFSPDGKFLAFDQKDGETNDDAWIMPLSGGGEARPISRSKFGEGSAKFSPDGRWIAYSSSESGKPEIYVQPFPGLGPKIQISNAGGTDPVWRRMGGELYYREGNKMMAVSVVTSGPELRASAPKMLFAGAYYEGTGASCEMGGPAAANYDVTPDGQRFLMVKDNAGTVFGTQAIVVLNWVEELKAKERARAQTASK